MESSSAKSGRHQFRGSLQGRDGDGFRWLHAIEKVEPQIRVELGATGTASVGFMLPAGRRSLDPYREKRGSEF